MNRRAFTLIELLVVLAVIMLLISLLVPSLRAARELARDAVCKSHLRPIVTTVLIYADDNKDYLPPGHFWGHDDGMVHKIVAKRLVGRNQYYGYTYHSTPTDRPGGWPICPSYGNHIQSGDSREWRYSWGFLGDGGPFVDGGQPSNTWDDWTGWGHWRKLRDYGSSRCVVMLDATDHHLQETKVRGAESQNLAAAFHVGYRHQGRANMIFFDGHVESHDFWWAQSLTKSQWNWLYKNRDP